MFLSQSLEILNNFNTLTSKQIFWKTQTLLKKLDHRFLVESTMTETTEHTFLYKTVMSEANFKTNRMGSTKWTYHKERSFASNCFIFPKILFKFKNIVQRVDLVYQLLKCPYSYFSKASEFYMRVFQWWIPYVSIIPLLTWLPVRNFA